MSSIIDDVPTMSLNEAWRTFLLYNDNVTAPEYLYSRWGVKLKFDIYSHLSGAILIKPKTSKVHIKGQAFDASDYYSELELREKIMKRWLIANLKEEVLFTPRGMGEEYTNES